MLQISRVARRRQVEDLETGKERMVHELLKKWPSLVRETLLIEEAAWLVNEKPEELRKNAKRAMKTLHTMPDAMHTEVYTKALHAIIPFKIEAHACNNCKIHA